MSTPQRAESRVLDREEGEMVARTHLPALRDETDGELAELIRYLRDRRSRARDIARQQRREMRGKSPPSGASAATDNTGSREKGALLGEALKRASKESGRRHHTAG